MGSSSPNRVENKEYLKFHLPEKHNVLFLSERSFQHLDLWTSQVEWFEMISWKLAKIDN